MNNLDDNHAALKIVGGPIKMVLLRILEIEEDSGPQFFMVAF
jgi:hypothetical protein